MEDKLEQCLMPSFSWVKEANRPRRGYDPYSVWALNYSDGFSLRDTQTITNPKDFTYQVILRNTEVSVKPGAAQAPLDEIPVIEPQISSSTFERDQEGVVRSTEVALCLTPDTEVAEDEASASYQVMRYPAPLRSYSIGKKKPATVSYSAQGLDPKTGVIVGVIDNNFNLVNARFTQNTATGVTSRIDFAWVQDGVSRGAAEPVVFGREHDKAELEGLLNSALSEDDRLQALGLLDFTRPGSWSLARQLSHGTHVLDTAAGFDPETGDEAARNCRIMAVQLPELVTVETSGARLAPFVVAGIGHMLDHAYEMSVVENFPIPVVLNFSYAIAGGPHDGTSIIETAIDTLVAAHIERIEKKFDDVPPRFGVQVVLPTGNRYLARGHANAPAVVGAMTELNLPWRVQPEDLTPNFCEIWVPEDTKDITLSVAWPGGTPIALPDLDRRQAMLLVDDATGDVLARVSVDLQGMTPAAAEKKRVLIALSPSAMPSSTNRKPGPNGLWHVQIVARLNGGEINAWIPRDDAPLGFSRPGLQSYFNDSTYERYTPEGFINQEDTGPSVIKRRGTLNGMATSERITVVGGVTYRDENPSYYAASSSKGMRDPDYSAVSDRSRVIGGILSSGSRSGSVLPMNGTSVSAPQVSRAMMQAFQGTALDPKTLHPQDIPPFDGNHDILRLGHGDLSRPSRDLESQR